MTNQLKRKVGFKGTPKLDPYWKSQPVTHIRIESVINDSRVGQNCSWPEQIGHRLDRQEVRRQRVGDLHNEDGSICDCKPIQG